METKRNINLIDVAVTVLFIVLMMLSFLSFGGNEKTSGNTLPKDTASHCQLISFDGKMVDGIYYINWKVVSNIREYYFVLEKKTDTENYKIIAIKRGFVSPSNAPIQFFNTDTLSASKVKITYRLHTYEVDSKEENGKFSLLSTTDLLKNQTSTVIQLSNPTIICKKDEFNHN